jgi:hypothetical protein
MNQNRLLTIVVVKPWSLIFEAYVTEYSRKKYASKNMRTIVCLANVSLAP